MRFASGLTRAREAMCCSAAVQLPGGLEGWKRGALPLAESASGAEIVPRHLLTQQLMQLLTQLSSCGCLTLLPEHRSSAKLARCSDVPPPAKQDGGLPRAGQLVYGCCDAWLGVGP